MQQRVGRYRLEEVIGVGSFATVHRAVDERLDDIVVVKALAENHSLNPEVRERFIAEGRSLRRVSSPHVVTIHDIGESDRQQPYLVLEHADRGTLAGRVAELRRTGWTPGREDVLVIARSLAAAVGAVHRAGLVHRDLSPGNILLTSLPAGQVRDGAPAAVVRPEEHLLVADLGMCKDLALNSGLTVAGGTSGFRPPEQEGPGLVDTRADLWALSMLLLWMCEGSPHGHLPGALMAALSRSTATDPAERHPDVAAWLADVESALAPQAPPAGSPSVPPAAPPAGSPSVPPAASSAEGGRTARTGLRGRRSLAVAGIALAALLGGIGGIQLAGGEAPSGSGPATVAVEGPTEVTVGQDARFTAVVEGVESWVWTLPTGAHVVDEPTVSVTARSPGSATVTLRARAPDGTDLAAVHRIAVTE